ncbi:MAG TPA: choice-of-anchor Q domain-containing protein, partial [Gaiellaceae bacterium]
STSACSDTQAPSAPTGLTAGTATATSIPVSWTASTDNTGVTGYGRYLNNSLVTNTTGTSYTFTGLTCSKSYTFAVDAYDAAGNRSGKASLTASTAACSTGDTQAPTSPTNLAAGTKTTTSIAVSWTASTDNVGVTGYGRYLNNSLVINTTGTSYTFTGLKCATSYTLAVDAYDAAGNRSGKATVTASTSACSDTQAPSAPTGLTAGTATATSIPVSWTASTDNVGVTGYGRYLNNSLVINTTGTSYTFTGLTCGTSYTLAVDAYDAVGNRSAKTQISAATSACQTGGASVFISPSGADSNPCSQSQPCKSFNRAYHAAAQGATVQVAGGSYGGETISSDSSKTSSADVLFVPASGASVTVTGQLNVAAAHIEFRNMSLLDLDFQRQADDVTVRNVINHGVWMEGPSNISIIGGEITCGFCDSHPILQNGGSDQAPPRNILFDGVNFHDWQSVSGEHTECLQILGGDGITIRNSIFKNCGTANNGLGSTADLFIGYLPGSGAVTKNVLIENNFLYPAGNPYVIQMSDLANTDLRYNSFAGPIIIFDREGPGTGMDFVGNILKYDRCTAENNGVPINWRYNVIQGGTCGSTDKNAAAGFIDPNNNLHLASGSAARNAGDPSSYPSTDIDGQARPMGGAPDAGADEAG